MVQLSNREVEEGNKSQNFGDAMFVLADPKRVNIKYMMLTLVHFAPLVIRSIDKK